jgi:hypothetical protein
VRSTTVWPALLGVEKTVVERVEFDEDEEMLVAHVRPRRRSRSRCGICRRPCPGYDRGEGRRRWRALDLGLFRAFVEADAPRVSCPEHGVVVAHVPWARHDTRRTRWPMLAAPGGARRRLPGRRWPAPWWAPPASWGWRRPAGRKPADAVEAAGAGRRLVQAAEAEVTALRDRAQAEVATADAGYSGAWQAARDAGWTPALLRGMGYPQPAAMRPARRPANSATAADPSLATAAS